MSMGHAPNTVSIDGYALNGLGWVAQSLPGFRDLVTQEDALVTVAGLEGAALGDQTPAVGVRDFTLTGVMGAASSSTLRANYRTLQYKAAGGDRVLIVVDDTARRITARLRSIEFRYLGRDLDTDLAQVTMQWRAIKPFWEDVSATTVNLTNVAAACAMGTAPVWPVVTVNQSCTVTYKNAAGTTIYSVTITGVTGVQTAVLDMETRTLTHSVSGVTPSLRTAGRYFPLSPYDGDYAASSWPTLTLSTGTGTAVYRKKWQG